MFFYGIQYRICYEWRYFRELFNKKRIKVGSIYEDCTYTLCVAKEVDIRNDYVLGVRLTDGETRGCSPAHCTDGALDPEQVADRIKNREA